MATQKTPPILVKSVTRTYKDEPPLVSLVVSNPVTYFRIWWKKVIAGEGIDLKLRIHPLTTLILAILLLMGGFGVGRLTFPPQSPIIKYFPQLAPSPTPNPWQETAFTGILHYLPTADRFSLETRSSTSALLLTVPSSINLTPYIGKRLLLYGLYNAHTQVFEVLESTPLELLPLKPSPIPTVSVIPTPVASL